jgi:mono/diheme cytochrome c family protein
VLTLTLAGAALQAQTSGDPSNGKLIFEGKGNCTSCHRIKGNGYAFEAKSPMPSFRDKLTAQELADVVAYPGALKPPPGAPGRSGVGGGAPPPG